MDMKLEVVVVPVSDVDRAKRFYQTLRFRLDIDYIAGENFRVAQLTPPGSEASRAELVGRGVDVGEVPPLRGRGTGERPSSGASRLWLVCLFQ